MHLPSALRLLLGSVQKRCLIRGLSENQQNSERVGRSERWGGKEDEKEVDEKREVSSEMRDEEEGEKEGGIKVREMIHKGMEDGGLRS